MSMLAEYALFFAKVFTVVIAILIVIIAIAAITTKGKERAKERLRIKNLNDKYKELGKAFRHKILAKNEFKKWLKSDKKAEKTTDNETSRKKIFVLTFQ